MSVLDLGVLDPATGRTPRTPVGRIRGATLYRYAGAPRHATPVLLVPNLGIAPPWIFDLLPGRSFAGHLRNEGFDFYLLDWGVPSASGPGPTLEDAVGTILPRACRMVLAEARAGAVSLVTYCMGTALALASFASDPPCALRALVTMAGPVDFARAGAFTTWVDPRHFHVDRLVDVMGDAPPALFWSAGTMLRPLMGVEFLLDVLAHAREPEPLEERLAVARWVREFVPVPGDFFRAWVRLFYQENRLYRGTLEIRGRTARLETIRCPVLVLAAAEDPIAPPASARALLDVVGSRDRRYLEVTGPHLALLVGDAVRRQTWPEIAAWLAARDALR